MATAERIFHEAAHAAAAGLLGVHVNGVYLEPNGETSGRVEVDHTMSPENLHRRMIITLAGLLESDAIPTWPLRRDRSMDERHLAVIADHLDLDAADYDRAIGETVELTLKPEYRALHTAVVAMADHTKHINSHLFARLQTIANPRNDMSDETDETEPFDLDAELRQDQGTRSQTQNEANQNRRHRRCDEQGTQRGVCQGC